MKKRQKTNLLTPSFEYENMLLHVLNTGIEKTDRTGIGTKSVFGGQMRFDLSQGFPLITTKKVHFKSIAVELLWILRGDTNVKWMQDQGVTIWDEWAASDGSLGPVYGKQWRNFGGDTYLSTEGVDQIVEVMDSLKNNPDSRRHIVSAWNPVEIYDMAIPPCHAFFQFYVADGKLSCQLYQRSADMFLGVPFNIASYALLVHLIAHQLDLEVGEFIWTGGDMHIYNNHIDQVKTQISRTPYPFPQLELLRKPDNLFDYKFEDFKINNYNHHEPLTGKVAV